MRNRKTRVRVQVQPKKKKRVAPPREKELTLLGRMFRGLGTYAGGALGGMVGHPAAGASVGNSLGASLSRWLGSGDYTVKENSILTQTMRGSASVPSMHRTDQTIVVRHREFIGVISGATAFQIRYELPLNPGLSSTFPWLSQIAANYQEYRFKGIVFHYIPTSGMVTGANPALGSVMMQTVYRANDEEPTSKYELLNEYWSNESMPCDLS